MIDDERKAGMMAEQADQADDAGRGLGGFAAGVLFGAVLGAGIALLFAPERGDKTRRRLRRRLERLQNETSEGLERAGTRTRRELARRRRRLEAGLERAADRARDLL